MIKTFQSEDVRRKFSMIDDVEVKALLKVQHIDTEYEKILNQRSEEMRVDPSMRIPFTKEELVNRGLVNA